MKKGLLMQDGQDGGNAESRNREAGRYKEAVFAQAAAQNEFNYTVHAVLTGKGFEQGDSKSEALLEGF